MVWQALRSRVGCSHLTLPARRTLICDRSPNFNPGGQLLPPAAVPEPLLFVQLEPRHSIYDSSENIGHLIVDASISHTHGEPITHDARMPWGSHRTSPWSLTVEVMVQDSNSVLASSTVTVGSTNNLIEFDLKKLQPQLSPYRILLQGRLTHVHDQQPYTASTELYYLPAKHTGSTVKIDNLNGGMLVANNVTDYAFEPLLPFGFYTSCSGYLNYSLANVSAYKDLGFNAINPVCAFTDGDLGYLFDWMDQDNLWYQYDMRGTYQNLSSVAEQIPLVKDRSNLLSWYTADEPDGWQYALNSTRLTYELLKKQDPYHPTGLVLNCQDYYFDDYTRGATDYIMEDAYPVGIDPTFSRKFNTTCNETYGDCGCDNCKGSLFDVSDRLDTFVEYQEWLGEEQKPLWSVLQAFSGESYWARDPTPEETWIMMILSFNHKAKAIMSWTFPASDELNAAHGKMAKVATSNAVSRFLIGGDPTAVKVEDRPTLDVAYWTLGSQTMVALANVYASDDDSPVDIALPKPARKIVSQPWGSVAWKLSGDGKLSASELKGFATSFLVLDH